MNDNLILDLKVILSPEGLLIDAKRIISGSDDYVQIMVLDFLNNCFSGEQINLLISGSDIQASENSEN